MCIFCLPNVRQSIIKSGKYGAYRKDLGNLPGIFFFCAFKVSELKTKWLRLYFQPYFSDNSSVQSESICLCMDRAIKPKHDDFIAALNYAIIENYIPDKHGSHLNCTESTGRVCVHATRHTIAVRQQSMAVTLA